MVEKKEPFVLLSSDDDLSFLDFSSGSFSLSDDESVDLISRRRQRAVKGDSVDKPSNTSDITTARDMDEESVSNANGGKETSLNKEQTVAKKPSKIPVFKQVHKGPVGDFDFDSDASGGSKSLSSNAFDNGVVDSGVVKKVEAEDASVPKEADSKDTIEACTSKPPPKSKTAAPEDFTDFSISNKSTTSSSQSDQLSYSLSFSIGEEDKNLEVDDPSEESINSVADEFDLDNKELEYAIEASCVRNAPHETGGNTAVTETDHRNCEQGTNSVEVVVAVEQEPRVDQKGFRTTYAITTKERRTIKFESTDSQSVGQIESSAGVSGCGPREENTDKPVESERNVQSTQNDVGRLDATAGAIDGGRRKSTHPLSTCHGSTVEQRSEEGMEEIRNEMIEHFGSSQANGETRKQKADEVSEEEIRKGITDHCISMHAIGETRRQITDDVNEEKIRKDITDHCSSLSANGDTRKLIADEVREEETRQDITDHCSSLSANGDTRKLKADEVSEETTRQDITDHCSSLPANGETRKQIADEVSEEKIRGDITDHCSSLSANGDTRKLIADEVSEEEKRQDITDHCSSLPANGGTRKHTVDEAGADPSDNIEGFSGEEDNGQYAVKVAQNHAEGHEGGIVPEEKVGQVIHKQKEMTRKELLVQEGRVKQEVFLQEEMTDNEKRVQEEEISEETSVQEEETRKVVSVQEDEIRSGLFLQEEEIKGVSLQEDESKKTVVVQKEKTTGDLCSREIGPHDEVLVKGTGQEEGISLCEGEPTKEELDDICMPGVEFDIAGSEKNEDNFLEDTGSTGSWIPSDIDERETDFETWQSEIGLVENKGGNAEVEGDLTSKLQNSSPDIGDQVTRSFENMLPQSKETNIQEFEQDVVEEVNISEDVRVKIAMDNSGDILKVDDGCWKGIATGSKNGGEAAVMGQTSNEIDFALEKEGKESYTDMPNSVYRNKSSEVLVSMKVEDEFRDHSSSGNGNRVTECDEEMVIAPIDDVTSGYDNCVVPEGHASLEQYNKVSQPTVIKETVADEGNVKDRIEGMQSDKLTVEFRNDDDVSNTRVVDGNEENVKHDSELKPDIVCNLAEHRVESVEHRNVSENQPKDPLEDQRMNLGHKGCSVVEIEDPNVCLDEISHVSVVKITDNQEKIYEEASSEVVKEGVNSSNSEEVPYLADQPSLISSTSDVIDATLDIEGALENSNRIDIKEKIALGAYVRPALEGASYASSKPGDLPARNTQGKVNGKDIGTYEDVMTEDDSLPSFADSILDAGDSEEILETVNEKVTMLRLPIVEGGHLLPVQREVYGTDQDEGNGVAIDQKKNVDIIANVTIVEKEIPEPLVVEEHIIASNYHVLIQNEMEQPLSDFAHDRKVVSEEYVESFEAAEKKDIVQGKGGVSDAQAKNTTESNANRGKEQAVNSQEVQEKRLGKDKYMTGNGDTQLMTRPVEGGKTHSKSRFSGIDSKDVLLARLTYQGNSAIQGEGKYEAGVKDPGQIFNVNVENRLPDGSREVVNDSAIVLREIANEEIHHELNIVEEDEIKVVKRMEHDVKTSNFGNTKGKRNGKDVPGGEQEFSLDRVLSNSLSDVSSIGFDEPLPKFEQKRNNSRSNSPSEVGTADKMKGTRLKEPVKEISKEGGDIADLEGWKRRDIEHARALIDKVVGIVSQLHIGGSSHLENIKKEDCHQNGTREEKFDNQSMESSSQETYTVGHAANFFQDISLSEGPPTIDERSAHVTYCKTLFSMQLDGNEESKKSAKHRLPIAESQSRDGLSLSMRDDVSENTSVAVDTREEIIGRLTAKKASASRFRSELSRFATSGAARRQGSLSRCSGSYREILDEELPPHLLARISQQADPSLFLKFIMQQNIRGKTHEIFEASEGKSEKGRDDRDMDILLQVPSSQAGFDSKYVHSMTESPSHRIRDGYVDPLSNTRVETRKPVVGRSPFPSIGQSEVFNVGVQTDQNLYKPVSSRVSNETQGGYYQVAERDSFTSVSRVKDLRDRGSHPQFGFGNQVGRRMLNVNAETEDAHIRQSSKTHSTPLNRFIQRTEDVGVQTGDNLNYKSTLAITGPLFGIADQSRSGFTGEFRHKNIRDIAEDVLNVDTQTDDVSYDTRMKTVNPQEESGKIFSDEHSGMHGISLNQSRDIRNHGNYNRQTDICANKAVLASSGVRCDQELKKTADENLKSLKSVTMPLTGSVVNPTNEALGNKNASHINTVSVEVQTSKSSDPLGTEGKKNLSDEDGVMTLIREMSELLSEDDPMDSQFKDTLEHDKSTKEAIMDTSKITNVANGYRDFLTAAKSGALKTATFMSEEMSTNQYGDGDDHLTTVLNRMYDNPTEETKNNSRVAVNSARDVVDMDTDQYDLAKNMMSKLDNVICNVSTLIDKTAGYTDLKLALKQGVDVEPSLQNVKDLFSDSGIDIQSSFLQNNVTSSELSEQKSSFLLANSVDDYLGVKQIEPPKFGRIGGTLGGSESMKGGRFTNRAVSTKHPLDKYSCLINKSIAEGEAGVKNTEITGQMSPHVIRNQHHKSNLEQFVNVEADVVKESSKEVRDSDTVTDKARSLNREGLRMELKEVAITSGKAFRKENEEIKAASKRRLKQYLNNIVGYPRSDEDSQGASATRRGLDHEFSMDGDSDYGPRRVSIDDTLEDEAIVFRELRTTVGNTSTVRSESIKRKTVGRTTSLERQVSFRRVKRGRPRKANFGRMGNEAVSTDFEEFVQSADLMEKSGKLRSMKERNHFMDPSPKSKHNEKRFDYYDSEDNDFLYAAYDYRDMDAQAVLEYEKMPSGVRDDALEGRRELNIIAKQSHRVDRHIHRATQTISDTTDVDHDIAQAPSKTRRREKKQNNAASGSEYESTAKHHVEYPKYSQYSGNVEKRRMCERLSGEVDTYAQENEQLIERLKVLQKREDMLQSSLLEESKRLAAAEEDWRRSQEEFKNCNNVRNLEVNKEASMHKLQRLETELKELKLAKKRGNKDNSEILQRIELLDSMMASEEKQKNGYKEAVRRLLGFTEDVANRLGSTGHRNHKALASRAKELASATRILLENNSNITV